MQENVLQMKNHWENNIIMEVQYLNNKETFSFDDFILPNETVQYVIIIVCLSLTY